MARVEAKEWFRPCAAQTAPRYTASVDPVDGFLFWVPTSEKYPIELWNGTTLYEVNAQWGGEEYFLRGEYTRRYASNSTEFITPVVGNGTGFVELTLDQVMKLLYRAKLLKAVANISYSGELSSSATDVYGAMSIEVDLSFGTLDVAGTPASSLATRNEAQAYCQFFNRWSTRPRYNFRISYDDFYDPPELKTGTGTGSLTTETVSEALAQIVASSLDNPKTFSIYQIEANPKNLFVRADRIWSEFSQSCGFSINIAPPDGSVDGGFTLKGIGSDPDFVSQSFRSGESIREQLENDWVVIERQNFETVEDSVDFYFFGDEVNHPGLLKSSFSFIVTAETAPVVTNNTTVSGSVDVTADKYWPYTDDNGNPFYDEDTGAQL
jgi:hypothetical protein